MVKAGDSGEPPETTPTTFRHDVKRRQGVSTSTTPAMVRRSAPPASHRPGGPTFAGRASREAFRPDATLLDGVVKACLVDPLEDDLAPEAGEALIGRHDAAVLPALSRLPPSTRVVTVPRIVWVCSRDWIVNRITAL